MPAPLSSLPGYRRISRDEFEVDARVPPVVIQDHLPAYCRILDRIYDRDTPESVRIRIEVPEPYDYDRVSIDGQVAQRFTPDPFTPNDMIHEMLSYPREVPSVRAEAETDEALRRRVRETMAGVTSIRPPWLPEITPASGDSLDRIAEMYGVTRELAPDGTLHIRLPGRIDQIHVEAKYVSDAPVRTCWQRLRDDLEEAAE